MTALNLKKNYLVELANNCVIGRPTKEELNRKPKRPILIDLVGAD